MTLMKKFQFAVSVTAVLAPTIVFALGQLSSPITRDNARRGQVITDRLVLNNADARTLELALSATGDIATWAQFFLPSDLQTPITSATIGAKANLEAVVKLTVPNDIQNGTYTGEIVVRQAAGERQQKEGAGAVVSLSVSRQVSIAVTDKEEIAFELQVIPASFDVKPGDPLEIKLNYNNTGNVQIEPQAHVAIKQDGKVVGETIFPYPADLEPVGAGVTGTVLVKYPTYELAEGKYQANVTAKVGEVEQSDEFTFSVSRAAAKVAGASTGGGGINPLYVAGGIGAVVVLVGLGFMLARRRA